MASHNIEAPTALSKSLSYESWLKELEIWQLFTDISDEKQGPAVFLTLEGKAKEAVLELPTSDIKGSDGVRNIIKKLDSLYKRDEAQIAFEAYENFEQFRRPSNMTMNEYIIEFERLLCRTRSHGSQMSENILAYRLLKSANLTSHHEELARATLTKLDYENMKLQLKKIFGDQVKSSTSGDFSVKIEN